jgi:hypothetical protein
MQHAGPLTSEELTNLFAIVDQVNPFHPRATIDSRVTPASETIVRNTNRCRVSPTSFETSLLRLEVTGAILRGLFRSTSGHLSGVTNVSQTFRNSHG